MKKVVILTGSAREQGNSRMLAESFALAAEKQGYEVLTYDAADLYIKSCRVCNRCFKTAGKACAFEDDFNAIADDILRADAVVFATPLYWYTFPASLKGILDKFYSFYMGKRSVAGKQCALLACCEETDPAAFQGLQYAYQKSIALLGWKAIGEVLIPGVHQIGDIKKTTGEKQAAELAKKLD